jgi:hypothetical protein
VTQRTDSPQHESRAPEVLPSALVEWDRKNDTKVKQNPRDTAWETLHRSRSEKRDMTRNLGTYNAV